MFRFDGDYDNFKKADSVKSLELTPNVVIAQALATDHFSRKTMKHVNYYEVITHFKPCYFHLQKNLNLLYPVQNFANTFSDFLFCFIVIKENCVKI